MDRPRQCERGIDLQAVDRLRQMRAGAVQVERIQAIEHAGQVVAKPFGGVAALGGQGKCEFHGGRDVKPIMIRQVETARLRIKIPAMGRLTIWTGMTLRACGGTGA